jgi:hypothetical protein
MLKTLSEVRSCESRLMIPRHVTPFTTSFASRFKIIRRETRLRSKSKEVDSGCKGRVCKRSELLRVQPGCFKFRSCAPVRSHERVSCFNKATERAELLLYAQDAAGRTVYELMRERKFQPLLPGSKN